MPHNENIAITKVEIYLNERSNKRKTRLRQLIAHEYDNDRQAFIKRTGINQGELSLLLKNGGKVLGEKRAANLAVAAGKPADYFDSDSPSRELPSENPPLLKAGNAKTYEEHTQPMKDLKTRITSEQQGGTKVETTISPQLENTKIKLPADAEKLKKNLLSIDDVAEILGVHKSTIYRIDDFPRPIKLGKQNRWLLPSLLAYIKAKESAANEVCPSCI